MTTLQDAIKNGDIDVLKEQIKGNIQDYVFEAILSENEQTLRWFIENGANFHTPEVKEFLGRIIFKPVAAPRNVFQTMKHASDFGYDTTIKTVSDFGGHSTLESILFSDREFFEER